MIEEYLYKAGMARAEMIDKAFWYILKTERPNTYALLIAFPWPWIWRLAGIRVETLYKSEAYAEYRVFQFGELLASFEVKQNFQTV